MTIQYFSDINDYRKYGLLCPTDGWLWNGLEDRFGPDSAICGEACCITKIKDITTYETYLRIIAGCRMAADSTDRELIEVEEWWAGAQEKEG